MVIITDNHGLGGLISHHTEFHIVVLLCVHTDNPVLHKLPEVKLEQNTFSKCTLQEWWSFQNVFVTTEYHGYLYMQCVRCYNCMYTCTYL